MEALLVRKNPVWKAILLANCALVILALMVPQLCLVTVTETAHNPS